MKNLWSRVALLEKFASSRPPRPCDLCGAPRGYVCGFVVVDTDRKPVHDRRCPACGIEVFSNGQAISPIPPNGYRDVLVLPPCSEPLPV